MLGHDPVQSRGGIKTLAVWRIDDQELEAEFWPISTSGRAAGEFKHKQARKFLAKIRTAKQLVVRLRARWQQDAVFDIQGIGTVAEAVTEMCGERRAR